jgi:uncharacterized Zn finger protein
MKPVNIKDLTTRAKGLRVRTFDPARHGDPYTAVVESESNLALNQVVTVRFTPNGEIIARCTCAWAQHGGMACSHVLATLLQLAERKQRALSFWLTAEEAQRQKHRVLRLRGGDGEVFVTSRRAQSAT